MRANDTLAEWLRRRPAKPMGSPRVGSNPTGVGLHVRACRYLCVGKIGLFRELNPGPPAPEAGIIPLDQTAKCVTHTLLRGCLWFGVVVVDGCLGRCLAAVARCLLSLVGFAHVGLRGPRGWASRVVSRIWRGMAHVV